MRRKDDRLPRAALYGNYNLKKKNFNYTTTESVININDSYDTIVNCFLVIYIIICLI